MNDRERRDFIRVPFRTSATIRTPDRTIWSDSTLDVSMNGIRIRTDEPVPAEGVTCEIEIILSDEHPPVYIEARGVIVRSGPGQIALNFLEIDLDGYEHLGKVVVNNAPDPAQAEEQIAAHWGIRRNPKG